jgi:hypothetical protein
VLGVNPLEHLLQLSGFGLTSLPVAAQRLITGREFFPGLIAAPFHHGLSIVFGFSAFLAVLAGLASLLRGSPPTEPGDPDRSGSEVSEPDANATFGSIADVPATPSHRYLVKRGTPHE